ncbi:kelch repeat and BTB domain-containing protein 2-like isoform X2 [Tubulanus polymorphus]|uniref:kelch repeat and BTB domain-containing protein 2-like isoform X2 n=1 Tax=Tubulanus polymorphus TaxID=672921 RepID=UPI003DA65527
MDQEEDGISLSRTEFLNDAHPTDFLRAMNEMYSKGQMVDVTLKGLVDATALNLLIDYCYTGRLEIDITTAQGLLAASTLFQMLPVQTACAKFMETELDKSNCVGIYCFARIHNCDELKAAAKKFIDKNFMSVIDGDEFMAIDCDRLIDFISSDDLDVEEEERVFECVVKWINYDLKQRVQDVDRLLDYIRFRLIDPEYRENQILEHKLMKSSAKCRKICHEVVEMEKEAMDESYAAFDYASSMPLRMGMIRPDQCLVIVGGVDSHRPSLNCYNPLSREAFILADCDARDKSFGSYDTQDPGCVVTPDNQIFVAGGNYMYKFHYLSDYSDDSYEDYDGQESLSRDVFWYDGDRDEWILKAPMLFPKANFSLACVDNKLYCFGGLTVNQHPTEIVERYDIAKNKWSYVGMMPTKLVDLSTVTHGNLIYLIGGRTGVGAHNVLISYNHRNNEWVPLAGMPTPRFHFGAIVIDDEIYTVGGQIYSHTSRSILREALTAVEIYNIEKDQWRHGPELPVPMCHVGLLWLDNDIYACGTAMPSPNAPQDQKNIVVYRLQRYASEWECWEDDLCDIRDYKCITAKIQTRKLSQLFRPDID